MGAGAHPHRSQPRRARARSLRSAWEAPGVALPNGWLLLEVSPDRVRHVKGVLARRGVPGHPQHEGWPVAPDAGDRRQAPGMTVVAPYGTWRSPISAEMVSVGGMFLMQPRIHDGATYWLEGRPSEEGRAVLVRAAPFSEPEDVTPPGFNVRTTVHEYGGGAYLLHDGVVSFSNFADQRLYRQEPGGDPVQRPIPEVGTGTRTDGSTPDGRWPICVRERHPEPEEPLRGRERARRLGTGVAGGARRGDLGQRVGVLEHHLAGGRAVQGDHLADVAGQTVGGEQRVEPALGAPLGPLVGGLGGAHRPDPAQRSEDALGVAVDHLEHLVAVLGDEILGPFAPDPRQ